MAWPIKIKYIKIWLSYFKNEVNEGWKLPIFKFLFYISIWSVHEAEVSVLMCPLANSLVRNGRFWMNIKTTAGQMKRLKRERDDRTYYYNDIHFWTTFIFHLLHYMYNLFLLSLYLKVFCRYSQLTFDTF